MLRTILESRTGPLTTTQFACLTDLTTTDIMVNNIGFKRRTSLADVIRVAEISFRILTRWETV